MVALVFPRITAGASRALGAAAAEASRASTLVRYDDALAVATPTLRQSFDANGISFHPYRVPYLEPGPLIDTVLGRMKQAGKRYTQVLWNDNMSRDATEHVAALLCGLYWKSGQMVLPGLNPVASKQSGLFLGELKHLTPAIRQELYESIHEVPAVEIDLRGNTPVFTVSPLSIRK